jgi:hypothetical protein
MHKFVKIALAVASGTLLFGAAVLPASAGTAAEAGTNADITCNVNTPTLFQVFTAQASGTGYEPNTELVVDETMTLDQKPWTTKRITVSSDRTGEWSTTTDRYTTRERGTFALTVVVSSPSGKSLGSATDACSM